MSEPMSSVEIEDVLSSIRRLVSEDLRPAAAAKVPAPEGESAKPQSGKLILTPALRVVPEEADEVAPDDGAPAVATFLRHGAIDRTTNPETAVAEVGDVDSLVASLGAAVDLQAQEWESATGDPVPGFDTGWDQGWAQPAWDGADEAGFIDVDATETAEVLAFDTEEVPEPAWAQEDVISTDLSAADLPPAVPAPDEEVAGTVADPLATPGPFDEPQGFEDPQTLDETQTFGAPDALADYAPAFADAEVAPVDPMDAPADDPSQAWADAAEAEVMAELSSNADAAASGLLDEADAAAFDAEMLQDLVRDIIREELQGALGERITRNVRKLVRAEIARALAVRDFE
jgi:hypothetical protein